MATKKVNLTGSKAVGFVAYATLLISGVCKILAAFGISAGILNLVADLLLVITVVWAAYYFAKSCTKTWRIIYWVLAILCLVGTIFFGVNALK